MLKKVLRCRVRTQRVVRYSLGRQRCMRRHHIFVIARQVHRLELPRLLLKVAIVLAEVRRVVRFLHAVAMVALSVFSQVDRMQVVLLLVLMLRPQLGQRCLLLAV